MLTHAILALKRVSVADFLQQAARVTVEAFSQSPCRLQSWKIGRWIALGEKAARRGVSLQPIWRFCSFHLTCIIVGFWSGSLQAETADVKYRGSVDLAPFVCSDITRSSFIRRVCYDKANSYMLINLNGTYYHYCEIGNDTVAALMNAGSMGRYYNAYIKGRFDCRLNRVPSY